MNWTPTDEQVKRGAAELMRDDPEYENGTYGPEDYEAMARAVLVAVGPHIAAQALWEAAAALRPTGPTAPALLIARARDIEKEAGR